MAGIIGLSKQEERIINENFESIERNYISDGLISDMDFSEKYELSEKCETTKEYPTEIHHNGDAKIGYSAGENAFELHAFPREEDERESAILALVEHIQRHDLNFFDEALAISRLIRYYGLTQEDAAQKLGRAQSTVANKLRLLRLTESERNLILSNKLTERHARSLLKLASTEDRMLILDKIINDNLNVEHTETMIEGFIGRQKERNSYKKRSKAYQNVNNFISTINRAVESMQANGLIANSRKIKGDDYIEFRVRIAVKH